MDNGNTFPLMHSFPQTVTAMNQVKEDPNTIWVGLNDGTVQKTHNAMKGVASTWTTVTVSGAPTGQKVSGIAIDPTNASTVVAVYPGYSGVDPPQHVFLTTNDGSKWSNISGTANGGDNNLPDIPLHAVVIVPSTSPHTIVVGSDAGVMQSADFGQTWQVLGKGFPNVPVTALALDFAVNPPVMRASTYGRSIFEFRNLPPTVTISANPNPITVGQSTTLTWSSTDATFCTTANDWSGSFKIGTQLSAKGSLTIKPTNTNGYDTVDVYYLTCTGLSGSGTGTAFVTVDTGGPRLPGLCQLTCVLWELETAGGTFKPGQFMPPEDTQPGPTGSVLVQSGTVDAVQVEPMENRESRITEDKITTITVSPGSTVVTAGEIGSNVRIVKAKVDPSELLARLPTIGESSAHPGEKPKIVGAIFQNGKLRGFLVARSTLVPTTMPGK